MPVNKVGASLETYGVTMDTTSCNFVLLRSPAHVFQNKNICKSVANKVNISRYWNNERINKISTFHVNTEIDSRDRKPFYVLFPPFYDAQKPFFILFQEFSRFYV